MVRIISLLLLLLTTLGANAQNLGLGILYLYPTARTPQDFVVIQDTSGNQRVTFWNTNSLGPIPSIATIQAAAIQAEAVAAALAAKLAAETAAKNAFLLEQNTTDMEYGLLAQSTRILTTIPYFDVAGPRYNGSGNSNEYSGTLPGGSSILTISTNGWQRGHGVWLEGAGAGGTNVCTFVMAVNATTLWLSNSVAKGGTNILVLHNDAPAIQSAVDDAYKISRSGTVLLRKTGTPHGIYNALSPPNPTNHGIISIPSIKEYVGEPITIEIRGETRGSIPTNSSGANSGVFINATRGPRSSGEFSSVIAASPFTRIAFQGADLTNWYNINLEVRNLGIQLTNNPTISGVQAGNALRAQGEGIWIYGQQDLFNPNRPDNTNAVGFIFPQVRNNIFLRATDLHIAGMYDGFWLTELLIVNGGTVGYCENGVRIMDGAHTAELTGMLIANNHVPFLVDEQATTAIVRFSLPVEHNVSSLWYGSTNLIVDRNNVLRGRVDYASFYYSSGSFEPSTNIGATKVAMFNTYSPSWGAAGTPTLFPNLNPLQGFTNGNWLIGTGVVSKAQLQINGQGDDAAGDGKIRLTGPFAGLQIANRDSYQDAGIHNNDIFEQYVSTNAQMGNFQGFYARDVGLNLVSLGNDGTLKLDQYGTGAIVATNGVLRAVAGGTTNITVLLSGGVLTTTLHFTNGIFIKAD